MSEKTTVEAVSRELVRMARARDRRTIWGIPWGFSELDKLTGGIHSEEMTVFMARPGIGKTQFMGQIALNVAEWLTTPEGKKRHPDTIVKLVLCDTSFI
jgi:replicative DNA helicase